MSMYAPTTVTTTSTEIVSMAHRASAPSAKPLPSLGSEELFIWLSDQVNRTDTDIREKMEQVKSKKDQNDKLKAVKQEISEHLTKTTEVGDYAVPDKWASWAYGKADPGGSGKIGDQDWYKAMSADGKKAVDEYLSQIREGGDTKVNRTSCEAFLKSLDAEIQSNTSNNELSMIELQSTISRRGQMIQLVSNMLHAMDETSKSIVGNTR